jgi:uncharacterized protein YutE (UPF0331/DUF86 family)
VMTDEKLDALRRYFEDHPDLGVASAYLFDRLIDLRRHLDHLHELRPRVTGPEVLRQSLSLSNDVLYSLQAVCRMVIDIASELSVRSGLQFQDYTEAVRNLAVIPGFSPSIVGTLEELPELRNALIYEYMTLDYARVIEALDRLGAVEKLAEAVRRTAATS